MGSQQGGVRRFLAQWGRRETVTFACKVAVMTGLLLTVGVQDDGHPLHFSLRFCVLFFLNVVVLYSVALHSYVRAERESAALTGQSKRTKAMGSKGGH